MRTCEPDIKAVLNALWAHCEEARWAGWDPYDGLMTQLPLVRPLLRSRAARLLLIQTVKRSPVNLRPVLRVPRLRNAKAVALGLLAATTSPQSEACRTRRVRELSSVLLASAVTTPNGVGWGYPFDWQSRSFWCPRGTPTVVCTGFVVRALHAAINSQVLDGATQAAVAQALKGSCSFVLHDLKRIPGEVGHSWSYTPNDMTPVVNATLLGAEILATSSEQMGLSEDAFGDLESSLSWALSLQRSDGGWSYGGAKHHSWEDSFHTGFNIESLYRIGTSLQSAGQEQLAREALEGARLAAAYYSDTFIEPTGRPWYFKESPWPLDTHSVAVAILTLLRAAELGVVDRVRSACVVEWALQNMRHPESVFLYQRRRYSALSTPMLRWSLAWMLFALSEWNSAQLGVVSESA